MMEWQAIDTAPKDQPILAAGQWLSGRWEIKVIEFLTARFPFVGQYGPSHWMPLPKPPEVETP